SIRSRARSHSRGRRRRISRASTRSIRARSTSATFAGSSPAASGSSPRGRQREMTSPRSVTRGESSLSLPVCLDYLSFTVPGGDVDAIVREACALLGLESVEERKGGMFGYSSSANLRGYGVIAYGG